MKALLQTRLTDFERTYQLQSPGTTRIVFNTSSLSSQNQSTWKHPFRNNFIQLGIVLSVKGTQQPSKIASPA